MGELEDCLEPDALVTDTLARLLGRLTELRDRVEHDRRGQRAALVAHDESTVVGQPDPQEPVPADRATRQARRRERSGATR